MTYNLKDKTIVSDDNNKDNNLFILDNDNKVIWRISEATNDSCTLISEISEDKLRFTTFNGMNYTLDIKTLKIIDKKVVK